MKIKLGVNIDHIATLREVRKSLYPNLLEAAKICKKAGADQITVHLREDRRHIQDHDVKELIAAKILPINLEMAVISEMLDFAMSVKPTSVTLVPERRAEMTTESGLNLRLLQKKRPALKKLSKEMKVYGFIDSDSEQIDLAAALELDGVEFHTGPFAHAFEKSAGSAATKQEIKKLENAAANAARLGLEVKAGHGLTTANVKKLLRMKNLNELNIGHSIVSRAVFVGLEKAIREMIRAISI